MKRKRLIILLILCLIFSTPLFASTPASLGKLSPGSITLVVDGISLNTYSVYHTNYIALSDLRQVGFNIAYYAKDKIINIGMPESSFQATTPQALKLTNEAFNLYQGNVYLGNMKSQALHCKSTVLIPVAALRQFGSLTLQDNFCFFMPSAEPPILAMEDEITNLTETSLNATIIDIYWGKNAPIINEASYLLTPGETMLRQPPHSGTTNKEDNLYITTLVQSASGEGIHYTNSSYNGQLNIPLMKQYTKIKNHTFLSDYGDPISPDKVLQVEEAVNNKNLASPTKYLVWTNTKEQRTYIYEGHNKNWHLIKHFICSTGVNSTPTPKGTFALTYKVPSFGQPKGYCCKYAFGFIGTSYLYHSIIYDKTGTYLLENKGVLGHKASQGCIRFSTEHAKWFYDHLITRTTVYIT